MHVLGELLEVLNLGLHFQVSLSNLLSASTFKKRIARGRFIQNVVRLIIKTQSRVRGVTTNTKRSFQTQCNRAARTILYLRVG